MHIQNLIDNFHSKERRGRSAVLNMVITETGAAEAVALALPRMAGRLTGNSIRVPTPNVSLAIMMLELRPPAAGEGPLTKEAVNAHLTHVALHTPLQAQMAVTISEEAASTDFVGTRTACTIDAGATIVHGNKVTLYAWYDNEFGYSCQVIRLAQKIAGIEFNEFPALA